MKPATTGERIILGDDVCNDARRLRIQRTACKVFASIQAVQIRAIDAAIADERKACALLAEAIRARSGSQQAITESEGAN